MVEVGVWLGIGNIVLIIVTIGVLIRLEYNLHARVEALDYQLASVIQHLVERVENIGSNVPDINLIQPNPFAQLLDFLRNRDDIATPPPPVKPKPMIEVEQDAPKKEKEQAGKTG